MSEEEVVRGVRNTKVIDLICLDSAADEVVLTMIEDRHWGESEEQLEQLEEKFNNYLDYILDGWLYSHYPKYQGKRCRIRVECLELPDDKQNRFFDVMRKFCIEQGVGFEVSDAAVE